VNGTIVLQEALRHVMRNEFPDATRRDVTAGLENGRKALPLLYAAAVEAPLDRDELMRRATAVYFAHCAGNIADDVADGECDYFEEGVPVATTVQYLLQAAFFERALSSQVSRGDLSIAARDLVAAASWQPVELRTERFDEATYMSIAHGMGVQQWRAYLRILWSETKLSELVETVAAGIALSSFVALDVAGNDSRFFSLPEEAQTRVQAHARSSLEPALATGLGFVKLTAAGATQIISGGAR
jgi:hypothetical protein